MTAMTTEATIPSGVADARPVIDRNLLLVIPAILLATLALLPFLSRDLGGSTLLQFVAVLVIVLGGIDYFTLKVPNLLVYPSIAFVLAGTVIVDSSMLDSALLGGAALLGIMFVLALIGRGSMGMGDVKFACLVGCALGWRLGIVALASGFALGALVAIPLLVLHLRSRKDSVPLTPFLAAGAVFWIAMGGGLLA